MPGKITVVGSSNVDFIMTVPALPRAGETVTGGEFLQVFGGKGANQAVAAARAGGDVAFLSALGDDAFAPLIIESLRNDGVDTSLVTRVPGIATGTALILVDEQGENCIGVAPGANGQLSPDAVRSCEQLFQESAVILLQMEIPAETNLAVLELARSSGTPAILNYAPARGLEVPITDAISGLIVNETEAGALLGRDLESEEECIQAAEELRERGPKFVILTLGAEGAAAAGENGCERVPAFKVEPVDTTAAGDTFCGALAVGLTEGLSLVDAVRFASAASALSVTRMGAQPSIPQRSEIDSFLKGE